MAYQIQREPLFADFIWSQPEQQKADKKLLIIGGNQENLQKPLQAFDDAVSRRLPVTIFLPDIFKQFKKTPEIVLAPSTPAGSFSKKGFQKIRDAALESCCLLLAGDLSANQETQQLITTLIKELDLPKIICHDSFNLLNLEDLDDDQLFIILEDSQLDKLLKSQLNPSPSTAVNNLQQALTALEIKPALIINDQHHCWLKYKGELVATPWAQPTLNQLSLALEIAVFLINNPNQIWPSLLSAIWQNKVSLESLK